MCWSTWALWQLEHRRAANSSWKSHSQVECQSFYPEISKRTYLWKVAEFPWVNQLLLLKVSGEAFPVCIPGPAEDELFVICWRKELTARDMVAPFWESFVNLLLPFYYMGVPGVLLIKCSWFPVCKPAESHGVLLEFAPELQPYQIHKVCS